MPQPSVETSDYVDAEETFKSKSAKFWIIILSIYASIFLLALDGTIIVKSVQCVLKSVL